MTLGEVNCYIHVVFKEVSYVHLPSEGRGQRFESSRVRHLIPL
ncbi:hypothetical protein SAMN04488005_1482 [Yoonia tamlensis]|uniref:Uncharacterized protein n=1 Tax=Yoonia tamlensis TaxID=390270 RepID=A0A1I6GDN7_9RHOB|nr:hypothetical protein SAMN04488005_1482 [Yoonia tamlensis]